MSPALPRPRRRPWLLAAATIVGMTAVTLTVTPAPAEAAAFGAGNLVVRRVDPRLGGNAVVHLDEYRTDGTFVRTITLPEVQAGTQNPISTALANPVQPVRRMDRAQGGTLLTSGADLAPGVPGIVTSHTIATVDSAGTVDTSVSVPTPAGGATYGVASVDGSEYWIANANGIDHVDVATGVVTTVAAGDFRLPTVVDGELYAWDDTRDWLVRFGDPLPRTLQGVTIIELVAAGVSLRDYAFVDRIAAVPGPDTLYLIDDTSTVRKYGLNAFTMWALAGTASVPGPLYGLAAPGSAGAASAVMYATSCPAGCEIWRVEDVTAGGLVAPVIVGVPLAGTAAPAGDEYRGISFVPDDPPVIVTQPAAVTLVPSGSTATVTVVADGPELSYQWFRGPSGTTTDPIAGATGPTLTTTPLTADLLVWVRVSNPYGVVDSQTAQLDVGVPPAITVQPTATTLVNPGGTATLSVTATGTAPLTYQWYAGDAGDTSAPVAGATAATFVTNAITFETSFWVRVSNAWGTADSNAAFVGPPITVVVGDREVNGLMTAIDAAVPALRVLPQGATAFQVPTCALVTARPATEDDYLAMLAGDPYVSVTGPVGAAAPQCRPQAVSVMD